MTRQHPACGSTAWVVLDNLMQLVAHGFASENDAVAAAQDRVQESHRKHYVAKVVFKLDPQSPEVKLTYLTEAE